MSYDDIITGINDGTYFGGGTFNITSGDEDGQVGNIAFENFENINFTVACFTSGTLIKTLEGEVPVEAHYRRARVLCTEGPEPPSIFTDADDATPGRG